MSVFFAQHASDFDFVAILWSTNETAVEKESEKENKITTILFKQAAD